MHAFQFPSLVSETRCLNDGKFLGKLADVSAKSFLFFIEREKNLSSNFTLNPICRRTSNCCKTPKANCSEVNWITSVGWALTSISRPQVFFSTQLTRSEQKQKQERSHVEKAK